MASRETFCIFVNETFSLSYLLPLLSCLSLYFLPFEPQVSGYFLLHCSLSVALIFAAIFKSSTFMETAQP